MNFVCIFKSLPVYRNEKLVLHWEVVRREKIVEFHNLGTRLPLILFASSSCTVGQGIYDRCIVPHIRLKAAIPRLLLGGHTCIYIKKKKDKSYSRLKPQSHYSDNQSPTSGNHLFWGGCQRSATGCRYSVTVALRWLNADCSLLILSGIEPSTLRYASRKQATQPMWIIIKTE